MARVRAVEIAAWLIRDTNSGITATIDPYGNVQRMMSATPAMPRTCHMTSAPTKPFTRASATGFAWMCVGVSAILVVAHFSKGKIARPAQAPQTPHDS